MSDLEILIERKTEVVDVERLRWHDRNPRVHPESLLAKLARSITEFGWTNPIIVAKDGKTILAGHARVIVAKRMGISHVPVVKTDLEGDKADAYMLADNRIHEDSEWDRSLLKDVFLDLDHGGFDLELTGFNLNEVEELMTAAPPPEGAGWQGTGTPSEVCCPECGHKWTLGKK